VRCRMMRTASMGAACACLLTTLAVGIAGPGLADSVTDRKKTLDQQIAQLRYQLEGTSKQFTEAAVTLRRSQAELVDVRARLAVARAALAKAQAHDAEVASQLAYARAQEAKTIGDLARRRAAQAELRSQLGLIAWETYVGSGDPGMTGLSVALQSDSPDQFAERLSLAGAALQSQTQAVNRLAVQQADLRARGEKLAAIRDQVAQLKLRSEAAVAARQSAQAEATEAESRQARLVADQTAALAVIKARSAAEKANLDQLAAEQNKLAAVLAARARAAAGARHAVLGPPPPASSSLLGYPASGPITSGFGSRFHPILHIYRMHTGIDFGLSCGTAVYAAADGTVVSSGWAGGYGNRVVIDHGWVAGADLATTYNHLSRVVVHSGSVRRGQLIAYSGTTGLSTGCHLHFEALANGTYVDPRRYL
jgi:murein DD-endopeptidase MepM/ murein hydrolase activator NlpD